MTTLAADWQRTQYNSGAAVAPIYPGVIRARKYIDVAENQYDLSTHHNPDEFEIVIPADGLVEIDYLPVDNPQLDPVLEIWSGSRKSGNQFEKVTGTGALTGYQVRVYPGQQSLDFSTDRAGELAYVTVSTAGSVVTASALNRVFAEIRAMQLAMSTGSGGGGESYAVISGEDIPADSFVYFALDSGTLKCYLAKSNDSTMCAVGYVAVAASTGAIATVIFSGIQTTIGNRRNATIPTGAVLFLSKNPGHLTWSTDADQAYNLDATDARIKLGVYFSANVGRISIEPNAVWSD